MNFGIEFLMGFIIGFLTGCFILMTFYKPVIRKMFYDIHLQYQVSIKSLNFEKRIAESKLAQCKKELKK